MHNLLLGKWEITFRFPIATNHSDLKQQHPELPLSTRTLVGTQRNVISLETILPGKYYHVGIEKGILDILLYMGVHELTANSVLMYIGIDGVHVAGSCGSQF